MTKPWTTPAEIAVKVRRRWEDGRILAARLMGDSLFPLAISISPPSQRALLDRFEEVQAWIKNLEDHGKNAQGYGYEIIWSEINHRQIGRNRIPASIIIPCEEDALRLIGKLPDSRKFQVLSDLTLSNFPELRPWLIRKPLKVLDNADKWQRLLAVISWFRENPQPGIFLRQMDIPGVDTKFIEGCKGLLTELLDILITRQNAESINPLPETFESRYGILEKPSLIRFRILDPRHFIQNLSDLAVPWEQFANLTVAAKRIFIMENDINGLAFPDTADSLVIFGLGYGIEAIAKIPWLVDKEILYWGDIDTHGFAMLNRLRNSFPHAQSLLMDRATLMAHQALWVEEPIPSGIKPDRLTREEQELFEDLVSDRLGSHIRLEQERISFGWVKRVLAETLSGARKAP